MLNNSFFSLLSSEQLPADPGNFSLKFIIGLHAGHPIFGGHFPGSPVVPGVCQIQMIHELLEGYLQMPLRLILSDQIKFLRMIDPGKVPELEVSLRFRRNHDLNVDVNATIMAGSDTFLKFKGQFSPTP